MLFLSCGLAIRFVSKWWAMGSIPEITALALVFSLFSGMQSLFFAMWFDSEYDK